MLSRKILIFLLISFTVSSCSSVKVNDANATRVDASRLYAFQEKFTDSATTHVTRDKGRFGAHVCKFGFYIDGQLAAHIGDGETASFYLKQGYRVLTVRHDLQDSGFCGALGRLADSWGAQRESFFASNESKRFRIVLPDMGTVDIQIAD